MTKMKVFSLNNRYIYTIDRHDGYMLAEYTQE